MPGTLMGSGWVSMLQIRPESGMFWLLTAMVSGKTAAATEHQIVNTMSKWPISALLLPASIWCNLACTGAEAQVERQVSHPPRVAPATLAGPKAIAIRRDASELESFAANEVRRYVYLRSGKVLPVKRGLAGGDRIVVSCKNTRFCGEIGNEAGPQQFALKSGAAGGNRIWWIVGGDEAGTLYGAYRFAEKLGIRFGLDEDVVPDERWDGELAGAERDREAALRFARTAAFP